MSAWPKFIGSEIYRRSRYGGKHPLAIPRVSLVMDLVRAMGWVGAHNFITSPVATPEQLARFHDPDYVAAVQDCEQRQAAEPDIRERFGLGMNGNPVFGEIFSRPATACGATLLAVEMLRDGGIVHSPAGGTHHGQPARASGFCYFNDPVLGLLAFLDQGLERIAYIDIDAHHGDGVEDALGDDPRVLVISVHERDRWPFTGLVNRPEANTFNFAVPRGFNDNEFAFILEAAILPLVDAHAPQAIFIQAGADALADDPLSKLSLSNGSHWLAVRALKRMAPRVLVVGGGGYNPYTVGRCWTGLWAILADEEIPDRLPDAARDILAEIEWRHSLGRNPKPEWLDRLHDRPTGGVIREDVRELVRGAMRSRVAV